MYKNHEEMRLLQTLKIYNNFVNQDIGKSLIEFSDFIFVINYLNNSIYEGKVKIKPWQKNLELLLFKLSQHGGSLIDAIKGENRRTHKINEKLTHADLSSTYVLARALMETYLVAYYLNFDSKDVDQCNFRVWLYEMSGLFRRQDYYVIQEEGKKKLKEEKIQIEDYKSRISTNSYFLSLAPKRQKKLLSGTEAKECSYEDIIKSRGIINPQFHIIWRLYSNYAHSEYLSIMQINDYTKQKGSAIQPLNALITDQILILTLQIMDLVENFNSAEFAYNALPTLLYSNVEARINLAKSRFFS